MTQDNMTKIEEAIVTTLTIIFEMYGEDPVTWKEVTLGRYFGTCDLAEYIGLDCNKMISLARKRYKEEEAKSTTEVPLAIVGQGAYILEIKENN